jgi:hypothetical protein
MERAKRACIDDKGVGCRVIHIDQLAHAVEQTLAVVADFGEELRDKERRAMNRAVSDTEIDRHADVAAAFDGLLDLLRGREKHYRDVAIDQARRP